MPNNDSTSKHARDILEKRNLAFRILYETVLKIETVSEDDIFTVLTHNLRNLCRAEIAALAIYCTETKTITLKTISTTKKTSQCNISDANNLTVVSDVIVQEYTKQSISKCLKHTACLLKLLPKSELSRVLKEDNTAEHYTLSCMHDKKLLAFALIQLPIGKTLKMKDMIDTYLGLASVVIERYKVNSQLKSQTCELQKTQKELIAYKNTLEEMVTVRTKALKKAKETAEQIAYELSANNKALIEAKKQAEQASKAKSNFLANMSHEIRTPINAITGFADLLKNTNLNEKQNNYLDMIAESSNILLFLINDILDISKIEAGQLTLENIDFDLRCLLNNIITITSVKVKKPNVSIVKTFPLNQESRFKGDPTKIRQIVFNFLSNALKFTEKGTININVTTKPANEKNKYNIIISVKDTGIGISKEKQKIIFKSFTQADDSTTRKYGGTGLGLTISKRLVDAMGGTVKLQSELKKGSCFTITIPLEKGNSVYDKKINRVKLSRQNKINVLIIETNEACKMVLHEYCLDEKINILKALSSKNSTFKWLSNTKIFPDLILCDIGIDKTENAKFIKKVRALAKKGSVKFIAIDSDPKPGAAGNSYNDGFEGYISKPFIKKELFSIIEIVLATTKPDQVITRHLANELSLSGLNVLVVEDNLINTKLISVMLDNLSCSYETTINGKEAIEKLKMKTFDIILMDLMMPVMGGLEATEIIRKTIDFETPIIALSAAVMQEDKDRAFRAGMNDFLAKPINIDKLKDILIKWKQRL